MLLLCSGNDCIHACKEDLVWRKGIVIRPRHQLSRRGQSIRRDPLREHAVAHGLYDRKSLHPSSVEQFLRILRAERVKQLPFAIPLPKKGTTPAPRV